MFTRNDENVRRCLWADITKSDNMFILVDDVSGNISALPISEKAIGCHFRQSLSGSNKSQKLIRPLILVVLFKYVASKAIFIKLVCG